MIDRYGPHGSDLKASKRYQSEILRVKDGLEYKQAMEEEVQ